MRPCPALAIILTCISGLPLQGQAPRPAVVFVHVADTAGAPLAGAELVLLKAAKEAVLQATSDAKGKHTFSFNPEDGRYQLVVRKVGYVQTARLVPVTPGDTFTVSLALAPLPLGASSLDTVRVVGSRQPPPKRYQIDADEIGQSSRMLADAWDVVRKLRPDILADKDRCPGEGLAYIWVNGQRLPAEDVPAAAPVSQPVRRPVAGRGGRGGRGSGGGTSGRPPLTPPLGAQPADPGSVIAMIHPEHIAEMKYLDCWDTSVPGIGGQRALFIVLKPGISFDRKRGSYADSASAPPPSSRPTPLP